MNIDMTCKVDLGDLRKFTKEMVAAVDRGVRTTAFNAQRKAQDRVPVDTGALKSSIFTVTSRGSGQASAIGAARSRRPKAKTAENLPPNTVKPMNAFIACGVEYGIFVEFGTMHRRGNSLRLGNRAGRIGVQVKPGETPHYEAGMYTLSAGYLFMTDAMEWSRRHMADLIKAEIQKIGGNPK